MSYIFSPTQPALIIPMAVQDFLHANSTIFMFLFYENITRVLCVCNQYIFCCWQKIDRISLISSTNQQLSFDQTPCILAGGIISTDNLYYHCFVTNEWIIVLQYRSLFFVMWHFRVLIFVWLIHSIRFDHKWKILAAWRSSFNRARHKGYCWFIESAIIIL
jgi:hypothetical protein